MTQEEGSSAGRSREGQRKEGQIRVSFPQDDFWSPKSDADADLSVAEARNELDSDDFREHVPLVA